MDQQRQHAGRLGRIGQQAHQRGHRLIRQALANPLAPGRQLQVHLHRLGPQLFQHLQQLRVRIAQRLVAGGVFRATCQQALQRILVLARIQLAQIMPIGQGGIQDQRPRLLRILPGVLQRHPRAVGDAQQIDPLQPQGLAHGLQIPHRVGGGVETQVRLVCQGLLAGLGERHQLLGRHRQHVGIRRHRAVQPVRSPRAALIHQHHAPALPYLGKAGRQRCIGLQRVLTRTARQQEDRILLGHEGLERRYPRQFQFDLSSQGQLRVFGHLQRTTQGTSTLLQTRGRLQDAGLELHLSDALGLGGRQGRGVRHDRQRQQGKAQQQAQAGSDSSGS